MAPNESIAEKRKSSVYYNDILYNNDYHPSKSKSTTTTITTTSEDYSHTSNEIYMEGSQVRRRGLSSEEGEFDNITRHKSTVSDLRESSNYFADLFFFVLSFFHWDDIFKKNAW